MSDQDDALCPTCGRIAAANWCNDDYHDPPLPPSPNPVTYSEEDFA
jgi:hypothetical protein